MRGFRQHFQAKASLQHLLDEAAHPAAPPDADGPQAKASLHHLLGEAARWASPLAHSSIQESLLQEERTPQKGGLGKIRNTMK